MLNRPAHLTQTSKLDTNNGNFSFSSNKLKDILISTSSDTFMPKFKALVWINEVLIVRPRCLLSDAVCAAQNIFFLFLLTLLSILSIKQLISNIQITYP